MRKCGSIILQFYNSIKILFNDLIKSSKINKWYFNEHSFIYYFAMHQLYGTNNYQKSIELLNRILKLNIQNPYIFYHLSIAYKQLNQRSHFIKYLIKSFQLNQNILEINELYFQNLNEILVLRLIL